MDISSSSITVFRDATYCRLSRDKRVTRKVLWIHLIPDRLTCFSVAELHNPSHWYLVYNPHSSAYQCRYSCTWPVTYTYISIVTLPPCCTIPLPYPTLLYSTLPYSTLLSYSTLLCSSLPCSPYLAVVPSSPLLSSPLRYPSTISIHRTS